jgi:hypothetical protein
MNHKTPKLDECFALRSAERVFSRVLPEVNFKDGDFFKKVPEILLKLNSNVHSHVLQDLQK